MRRPFSPRTSWVWVARMMISVRAWVTRTSQPEYPSEERVRVKNSESSALQTEGLGQALPPVTNTRTRRLPELGERSENHGQSPPQSNAVPSQVGTHVGDEPEGRQGQRWEQSFRRGIRIDSLSPLGDVDGRLMGGTRGRWLASVVVPSWRPAAPALALSPSLSSHPSHAHTSPLFSLLAVLPPRARPWSRVVSIVEILAPAVARRCWIPRVGRGEGRESVQVSFVGGINLP